MALRTHQRIKPASIYFNQMLASCHAGSYPLSWFIFVLFWIRFEAGTPAIGEAIGLGAAIDYLSGIGMQKIHDYEVCCSLHLQRLPLIKLDHEFMLILNFSVALSIETLSHMENICGLSNYELGSLIPRSKYVTQTLLCQRKCTEFSNLCLLIFIF